MSQLLSRQVGAEMVAYLKVPWLAVFSSTSPTEPKPPSPLRCPVAAVVAVLAPTAIPVPSTASNEGFPPTKACSHRTNIKIQIKTTVAGLCSFGIKQHVCICVTIACAMS